MYFDKKKKGKKEIKSSIQATRSNAISLEVCIEDYFRNNNLDIEIKDYEFGNGASTGWTFYCEGEDFKYIDDDTLHAYIEDLEEFKDENFEVFSFRDRIDITIKNDEDDWEDEEIESSRQIKSSPNFKKYIFILPNLR